MSLDVVRCPKWSLINPASSCTLQKWPDRSLSLPFLLASGSSAGGWGTIATTGLCSPYITLDLMTFSNLKHSVVLW